MTTLYQYAISPFCDKVRRVLNYKGIAFEVENITVAQTITGKLKKLNPAAKVPVLDIDGQRIADSTDIIHYLETQYPERALLPADPRERAWVDILEDWADESLYFYEVRLRFMEPANARRWVPEALKEDNGLVRWLGGWATPIALGNQAKAQGVGRKPAAVIESDLARHFADLSALLGDNDWLVGDRLTLADIAVFAQVYCLSVTEEGARLLVDAPKVRAWMARVDAATGQSAG